MKPRPPMATVHGKIRGKIIEIEEDLGLPDGQAVTLDVHLPPGDGIRLSAGAWADAGPDLEETLAALRGKRRP